jgi:hypothetical protein
MIFLAAASILVACSKGNEHLSRDVYTPLTTVTFNMPAITQVDSSQTVLEVETPLNLDSIIKNTAGNNYGISDIKSIKLRSLRLDVVDLTPHITSDWWIPCRCACGMAETQQPGLHKRSAIQILVHKP